MTTKQHADTRRLRIMVVEDDREALAVMLQALEALGHWATGLANAELALNRFLQGAFDVLMADIGLPALSGQDLAEILRAQSGIPVIFVTGRPRPDTLPEGVLWLRKPFDIDQLREALAQATAFRAPPP